MRPILRAFMEAAGITVLVFLGLWLVVAAVGGAVLGFMRKEKRDGH